MLAATRLPAPASRLPLIAASGPRLLAKRRASKLPRDVPNDGRPTGLTQDQRVMARTNKMLNTLGNMYVGKNIGGGDRVYAEAYTRVFGDKDTASSPADKADAAADLQDDAKKAELAMDFSKVFGEKNRDVTWNLQREAAPQAPAQPDEASAEEAAPQDSAAAQSEAASIFGGAEVLALEIETAGPLGMEVLWTVPPVITKVEPGSAAASAGLQMGHIVLALNGADTSAAPLSEDQMDEHMTTRPLRLRVTLGTPAWQRAIATRLKDQAQAAA
eukprot:TRINITY_DN10915_c0_g1_i1.p1 TRINITY_DN10915_c0_g1~~TRINITY_DN10915_c0_g1_i1.p1  ORF type:complete len:273 (-),score=68.00 TRINITY_DN10915_c0_g1_i1:46-864(-)